MDALDRSGPSGSARWERRAGDAILVLADARNDAASSRPLYHCVPPAPRLARTPAGDPLLTLTVLLARQPDARDEAIRDLIEGGSFGVTFTLALPEVAEKLAEFVPLFCASASFELLQDERVLARAEAAGVAPRAALSMSAGREVVPSLFAALEGQPSGLAVRSRVRFRCAPAELRVQVDASYAEMFDVLAARCDPDGRLTADEVREAFDAMLEEGVVRIDADGAEVPRDVAFASFVPMSSIVLNRDGDGYRLRRRPHPAMRLSFEKRVVTPSVREVTLSASLEEIIGGAAKDDPDRFIHLIAPSGNGSAYTAVPRLVRSSAKRGPATEPPLTVRGTKMTSLALALTPDTTKLPSAHALIAGDAARLNALTAGRTQNWLATDVVLATTGDQKLRLPIVDDATKTVYVDRADASKRWYAPSFTLERPAPSDDPARSAFAFTFAQNGVTASGEPALSGKVRFRLKQAMSDATRRILGAQNATPVPCSNVSIVLEVPFRDSARGITAVQNFVAEVQRDGDTFTATVSQIDDWVRLTYGALAYPNFQTLPARVRIAYAFRAYVPMRREPAIVGQKIAETKIATASRGLPDAHDSTPVFDAAEGVLRVRGTEVQLRPERPGAAFVTGGVAMQQPMLHVAPLLQVSPTLVEAAKVRYATQTIVREEVVDAFFPCSEFGGLYVQTTQPPRAIGCTPALRLGEVTWRQYEELHALRHSRYAIYRSLQQPGRFLVVPSSYRVTRYGPAEGAKAYRTAAMLYALIDSDPAQSRYFLTAALEPDIPFVERQRLLRRVAPYTPFGTTPMFDFPTSPSVQASASYRFSVPAAIGEPSVLQVLDTLHVSVSTSLANALTLTALIETSGLVGVANFALPDGTMLQSSLLVDTHAIGPANGGPVSIEVNGSTATLTNRIGQTVNVVDVVVTKGNIEQSVRIDAALAPKQSVTCTLPAHDFAAAVIADSTAPVSLRQLDLFVEDVFTNVIFVNLIHHANHALRALKVEARLKGSTETRVVDLGEGEHKVLNFTVAISSYLDQQILEYRFLRTVDGGAPLAAGPMREWDLKAAGNVVSVTWASVA